MSSMTQRKASAITEIEEENEDEAEYAENDGEGSGSDEEDNTQAQGDLARGMEGERVLKSGYLWKKQERRKVSCC
jgi:hypothetical protein